MNANIYMLEKEWIEHKMVSRVPLAILLCGLLLMLSIVMSTSIQSNVAYELTYNSTSDSSFKLGKQLSDLVFGFTAILSLILSGLYFPKTLRKERQEGSAMFWRSMPVSDSQIHLVKLSFGFLAIPLFCSILVFSADFLMWLINTVIGDEFPLFSTGESSLYIFTNWLEFVSRMWLVGVALLPLATTLLAISQKMNSPLVVMLVVLYVVKVVATSLLGLDSVGHFIEAIAVLPLELITAKNPFNAVINMGMFNLTIYVLLGVIGLFTSLRFAKYVD